MNTGIRRAVRVGAEIAQVLELDDLSFGTSASIGSSLQSIRTSSESGLSVDRKPRHAGVSSLKAAVKPHFGINGMRSDTQCKVPFTLRPSGESLPWVWIVRKIA